MRAQRARALERPAHAPVVSRMRAPAADRQGDGAGGATSHGFDLTAVPAVAGLPISSPQEPAEKEADRTADRVMRGEDVRPAPMPAAAARLERKCDACEEEEGRAGAEIRREPLGAAPPAERAPPAVAAALRSPGRPLDAEVRADFEPRFGTSFADVRVHHDSSAAIAARSIGARAFTLGREIAFGAGEYAPETRGGRFLLAHELAHVVQNGGNAPAAVRRYPYETAALPMTRQYVASWTIRDRYIVSWDPATWKGRLEKDAAETEAVLAAVLARNPPEKVTAPSVLIVSVQQPAKDAGAAPPPPLLYRFELAPPSTPGDRPTLYGQFIASGAASQPLEAPAAPTGYKPGKLEGYLSGFPAQGKDAYFAAYPQEHAQLASFIDKAPAAVDQLVRTATTTGAVTTHQSLFRVIRTVDGQGKAVLDVTLLSEPTPGGVPAAVFRLSYSTDLQLEELRAASRPEADRLGAVTLPDVLAAEERTAVNLAIYRYFAGRGVRMREVDARLPVGGGERFVLFTLRFGAGNDVTVERLGEAGTGPGQIDTGRIDVTRANGFPGAASSDSALRGWWKTRYRKGGTLKTKAPSEPAKVPGTADAVAAAADNVPLISEMNALIAAGCVKSAWFRDNYGVTVMGAEAAKARMISAHGATAADVRDSTAEKGEPPKAKGPLADMKDFSTGELTGLENAYQTLGTGDLGRLSGVSVGRKGTGVERKDGKWVFASYSGYAMKDGDKRTILYFDSMHLRDDHMFLGGSAANALPAFTMTILHETGHVTEYTGGIRAAFNAWLKDNPQEPPTWYSKDKPKTELFPEAYALFHADPKFLCASAPLMYAWFLELSRKGTAPAANAKLKPPPCPG